METLEPIPLEKHTEKHKDFGARIYSFAHRAARSCYDMEFYRGVRIKPWSSAFRYAVAFHAMIVLVMTAVLLPTLVGLRAKSMEFVGQKFPAGTTIAAADGKITTNLMSPFEIQDEDFEVIIDTTVHGLAPSDTFGKKPGVFVGRDVIVVQKDATERRSYSAAELPKFSVTKEEALAWMRTWSWLVGLVAAVAFALILFFGLLVGVMVYTALAALVAMVLGQLWNVRLKYSQWHATALHAVTLPILVDFGSSATGFKIPYVYTFIFYMIIVAVIADERSRPTPQLPTRTHA